MGTTQSIQQASVRSRLARNLALAGLAAIAVAQVVEHIVAGAYENENFSLHWPWWLYVVSSISLPLLGLGLLALIAAITARAIGIDLGERKVNWRLAWAVVVTVSAFLVLLLWPHEESTFLPGANLAVTIASVVPALTFARPRSRIGWLAVIIPVAVVSMRPWSLPDTTDWLPGLCWEVQISFFFVGLLRGALFAQDAQPTKASTRHPRPVR